MATASEIAKIRAMINEPNNVEPYTDEMLSLLIDASLSVRSAAAEIWRNKASKVAHLVDISEGGSSRKMSDIYKNYLAIASALENESAGESGTANRGSTTRAIERT